MSPGKLLEADDQSPALPSNPPAGTTASLLDPSFVISDKSMENFSNFETTRLFLDLFGLFFGWVRRSDI